MITKECIETTYSFFHQKRRIYEHSTLEWQKDDIEYAIASYVDEMNAELYAKLSRGRADYLKDHQTFLLDIADAEAQLEQLL